MKIKCQQQDIFKIRDGIPGHGLQEVKFVHHKKYVYLVCGCHIPLSWLPKREQEICKTARHIPK